jgi:ABC-2 type transport system permease protein
MKLFRDTWLLFTSYLTATLRQPAWIIISLFQPICYLLLFAPLLENISGPGFQGSNSINIFTPGTLVMLGMFGTLFVGFGLISELRAGVVERLRVTPVSRLAPLLARALRDAVILFVQSILLVLVAIPMGLKANFWGVLISFAIILLMGVALASVSYAMGLLLKSEDAFAPLLNVFTLPLLLLSGITLPLTFAPDWLKGIAAFTPFSHIVDGTRALFVGDWANNSIWLSIVVVIVLCGLSVYWASRTFRQATA